MKRNTNRRGRLAVVDQLEARAYLSGALFGAPTYYGGLDNVGGIAVGSLTTGGLQDIVVSGDAPGTTNAAVGVYLNKGGGKYGTPTLLPFIGTPGAVALGDFLGNGKMDVAALDPTTDFVNVFLNDGAGNFTRGVGESTGGTGDSSITVGDFNGDHIQDIAVSDTAANEVDVFISKGLQGSFAAGAIISVPSPTKVIAADVSGDGKPDLVIVSSASPGSIYVAINDGTGNFAAPTQYSIGSNIQSVSDVAVADFNADSHPDIVGLGIQSGSAMGVAGVLLNQGNGVFDAATSNTVASGAMFVGAGNFANIGGIDIADVSSTGGLDVLAHGGAIGTFQADQTVFTNQLGVPGAAAVFADLDGNGLTDVALLSPSNHGFGVSLNTSAGGIIPPGGGGNSSALTPTVSGVLPTANVVGGIRIRPIHEKVTINDNSNSAVIGAVKVEIVLSPTTTPATGDPVVASLTRRLTFKGHQTRSFVLSVNSLPASAGGAYYLVARVTDPTLETNTGASATTISVVPATIDLSGAFVTVPATAKIGHPIAATITVTNSGSVPTTQRLEMKVYASESGAIDANAILIADLFRAGPIRPGKPVKIRISKTIAKAVAAGNYNLIVQLDPANVFNDTNVMNNTIVSLTKVALA